MHFQVLQLSMLGYGMFNSILLACVDSLAYRSLDSRHHSKGVAIYSMGIKITMGLGVAFSGLVLFLFMGHTQPGIRIDIVYFRYLFEIFSIFLFAALLIFYQLSDEVEKDLQI